MKKVFLNILLVTGLNVFAQTVTIPDANFKAALLADPKINTNKDTEIQVSEALAFTETIQLYYIDVQSLVGIEAFVNLKELFVVSCKLTSLDVSKNTALTSLNCYGNQLTSLDVSKNTALIYLACDENQLTSLDVSKIINLQTFYPYNPNLKSICIDSKQKTTSWYNGNPNIYTTNCIITTIEDTEYQEPTVLKAYNMQGIEVSKDTKRELIILQYSNGKTHKVIQQ